LEYVASSAFLADVVLLLHFAFVVFVVAGGLVVLRWPRVAWAHFPAAAWGALIEFGGWICPLTPLENRLRAAAGQETYTGDFVARYVMPVLYPAGLTRETQIVLGVLVVAINVAVYWRLLVRRSRRRFTVQRSPLSRRS
jgi:hypothetical protein